MARIRAYPGLWLRAAVLLLRWYYCPQDQIVPHFHPFRMRGRLATAGESSHLVASALAGQGTPAIESSTPPTQVGSY